MPTFSRACSTLILGFSCLASALDPSCAPGGNFNLKPWMLQLPIGSTGNPTTISSSQLQGCSGYQDNGHHYFFTESGDGALVMKVPGSPASSGCVTTAHSTHCRTELREANPSTGGAASWQPSSSRNRLAVTLAVTVPDNSGHGTVIGQIHIDDSVSVKPVCELYYNKAGNVVMGVEQTTDGGNSIFTSIGNIPVGQTFSYEIRYESNVLSVSLNGGAPRELDTYELNSPPSYFKVGNYNQGDSPSDVHFFSIDVQH
ncbi:hypothetical protein G647_10125 [Cladophialophora carrionii CBS 160.54]|uniref:Alginate lyase 2 domain-containing protein n=1 Tax=Cladophialophora carrionii CBS 160.54 TaxID=1279043 RepID=V9DK14_9EURO|nr:uncharacterized protein G647_10125 [Cladophialophora carrionii CBS 160.54]ETI27026.1 hypothetical protein G647_10125 [Cladophialophora carrionii CBS 160.54]